MPIKLHDFFKDFCTQFALNWASLIEHEMIKLIMLNNLQIGRLLCFLLIEMHLSVYATFNATSIMIHAI